MSTDKMFTDKMSTYKMTTHNEELIASVNQTELAKWIEAGELYEEHEEVLLNQNERTYSGSVGARRNHVDNDGNHIAGETFYGKLPPRELQPPEVMTANIVINPLNPTVFPTLSEYTVQMLNDLNMAGLLNRVIGLSVNCKIRRFPIGENRR
ncbi:8570_t:CDS:2 [Rhizophagus irregularis]|nr:8570_t:CDS:2 [Rhizophagus irregularis]